ncbi:hypothetical protein JMY91_17465 [Brenneria goodwinii]|nr:hypothetical protein [Brenneria goodwinii]
MRACIPLILQMAAALILLPGVFPGSAPGLPRSPSSGFPKRRGIDSVSPDCILQSIEYRMVALHNLCGDFTYHAADSVRDVGLLAVIAVSRRYTQEPYIFVA